MSIGFEVNGKVALVTGANRGIGKAIVDSLIEAGASKVYAAVRTLDKAEALIKEYGDRVIPIRIDLEIAETVIDAAKDTKDVQLVVNNAGILKNANPLADNAVSTMQNEIEVNVFGLIRMAQAFAPALKANGGGAFVQLNSVASLKCFSDFATYSASKAAAYSITQGLKEVLAEQNTLVLSVHPGPIATDMAIEAGFKDIAEPSSVVSDGIIAALKKGDFHLFPDTMAQQLGQAYQSFARGIIEADQSEN